MSEPLSATSEIVSEDVGFPPVSADRMPIALLSPLPPIFEEGLQNRGQTCTGQSHLICGLRDLTPFDANDSIHCLFRLLVVAAASEGRWPLRRSKEELLLLR